MEHVKKLTHRQRQALDTQRMIISAARDLFLEQGYGLTTIEAISERAGVAVSTVYAVFKNKRGLLKAIREDWHQQSQQRDLLQRAVDQGEPEQQIALAAHATRRAWETGAALIAIYKEAASTDAEAAAELAVALTGRRGNIERLITTLSPHLKSGLPVAMATDLYLALTLPEVYQQLVEASGWSPDAYEAWLTAVLKQQLLGA